MKITTNYRQLFFELIIEVDKAKITSDIAESNGIGKPWMVNPEVMKSFEVALFDMADFNGTDRVEFLKQLVERNTYAQQKEELSRELSTDDRGERMVELLEEYLSEPLDANLRDPTYIQKSILIEKLISIAKETEAINK